MSNANKPVSFEVEKAYGDGWCAYNAFALALAEPDTVAIINASTRNPDEQFKAFLQVVAPQLGVAPNWHAVSQKMVDLKKDDKKNNTHIMQDRVQAALANLAIGRLSDVTTLYGRDYEAVTLSRLLAEFTNPGDVMERHVFITQKYDEIRRMNAAQQTAALEAWWKSLGFQQFLTAMRKHGTYAGDLELAPLGEYFGVNLLVSRAPNDLTMHLACGGLQVNDSDVAKELRSRGVIQGGVMNMIAPPYALALMTKEVVRQRLSEVPSHDTVRDFIRTNAATLPGTQVPAAWSAECVAELTQRGVVSSRARVVGKVFALDATESEARINAMPDQDKILAQWEQDFRVAATITLKNDNATHWDNAIAQPDTEFEAVQKEANEKFNAYFDALSTLSELPDPNDPLNRNLHTLKFTAAFEEFHKLSIAYKATRDLGLFHAKKTAVLNQVEEEVKQLKK